MAEYVLVLLEGRPGVEVGDDLQRDHVDFIDSLIARNLVLLGGSFDGAVGGARAGHVLACPPDAARALADEDPVARAGAVRSRLVRGGSSA